MPTKIGIVVSDFNDEITSKMERKAESTAKQLKLNLAKTVHVPGSFEIPFAADLLIKKVGALVVLGVVIGGETYHDVVIMNAISSKILDISLKYGKPIGFGIIGPRATWKQAESRAEEYAERAVKAVYKLLKLK